MHRTNSLDYTIMLSIEIWMVIDEVEDDSLLKAGDAFIQIGKNHAWSNSRIEPCIMVLVSINGVSKRYTPKK